MQAQQVFPAAFPYDWASDWGEDAFGVWVAFTFRGIRQAFRWIPADTFQMGSPEEEPERSSDEMLHEVVLTEGFWMAETVCTQALWRAVMGEIPSDFKGDERPVENVSWEDAADFMTRLNKKRPDLDLRLPTEAEWEYACRAGTQTPFWFGDQITTDQANYDGNYPYAGGEKGQYRAETVEIKALPCNDWGLYQMHGNVWEWCADWYGDYPAGTVTDPTGPAGGDGRVLRGGSWINVGGSVRSAVRSHVRPAARGSFTGFRLARGL